MCVEKCPQNVFLTEIFENLKNKIVQTGESYPDSFKTQAKAVLDSGLALSPTPPILRRREELKLPKVETADSEELKKLLKTTNFIEKIHLNGGK
jgi:heterodisulfide reductase subunit C